MKNKQQIYEQNKKNIFKKLGEKCQCCGLNDYQSLSIDHVHGGGRKEKMIVRGESYLRKLKKMPTEELQQNYQLLCYNCNYCKGSWGVCAHLL